MLFTGLCCPSPSPPLMLHATPYYIVQPLLSSFLFLRDRLSTLKYRTRRGFLHNMAPLFMVRLLTMVRPTSTKFARSFPPFSCSATPPFSTPVFNVTFLSLTQFSRSRFFGSLLFQPSFFNTIPCGTQILLSGTFPVQRVFGGSLPSEEPLLACRLVLFKLFLSFGGGIVVY